MNRQHTWVRLSGEFGNQYSVKIPLFFPNMNNRTAASIQQNAYFDPKVNTANYTHMGLLKTVSHQNTPVHFPHEHSDPEAKERLVSWPASLTLQLDSYLRQVFHLVAITPVMVMG